MKSIKGSDRHDIIVLEIAPDKLVNVITIDNIRFKILLDRIGRFSSTDTGRQQLTGALLKKI